MSSPHPWDQHPYPEPWKPHKESKVGQQGGVQHADEGPTDRQDDDAE